VEPDERSLKRWRELLKAPASKESARSLVAEVVRLCALRAASGAAVVRHEDVRDLIKARALKGITPKAVMATAAEPLAAIWGYDVTPAVGLEGTDAAADDLALVPGPDFLLRVATGARSYKLLKRAGHGAEGVEARRRRGHAAAAALADAVGPSEAERRGVLAAVLGCLAASKTQALTEQQIARALAASGDAAFCAAADALAGGRAKAAGGGGAKRARAGDDDLDEPGRSLPPGGLPLHALLAEFVEQRWLHEERKAVEDVAVEADDADAGGGAGAEGEVKVFRAGARARGAVGVLGAADFVRGVTGEGTPMERAAVAAVMRHEVGPTFLDRVPANAYDAEGEGEVVEDSEDGGGGGGGGGGGDE